MARSGTVRGIADMQSENRALRFAAAHDRYGTQRSVQSVVGSAWPVASPRWRPHPGDKGARVVGTLIGQYRIVSVIGSGGMGTVYVGEHTLIGRRSAIKVLNPELSQRREIVHRFFNEARAA